MFPLQDPSHSLSGTAFEVYGTTSVSAEDEHDPAKVTMGGFVATEIQTKGEAEWGPHIMDCLAPEHVPVITTLVNKPSPQRSFFFFSRSPIRSNCVVADHPLHALFLCPAVFSAHAPRFLWAPLYPTQASEFAVFDRFFAGIPGPTIPNRLFGMSATSGGYSTNDHLRIALGWPQDPLFRLVEDVGLDWRVYFQDAATVRELHTLSRKRWTPPRSLFACRVLNGAPSPSFHHHSRGSSSGGAPKSALPSLSSSTPSRRTWRQGTCPP
jgi:hypothetical protein